MNNMSLEQLREKVQYYRTKYKVQNFQQYQQSLNFSHSPEIEEWKELETVLINFERKMF